MFEMLTGRRPFTGDTPLEQATARILYPPPHLHDFNAALPDGWDWVLQKALAREKTERYQSVAELMADVEAVANGRDPSASPVRSSQPDVTTATILLPAEPEPVATRLVTPPASLMPETAPPIVADATLSTPIKPGAGGAMTAEKENGIHVSWRRLWGCCCWACWQQRWWSVVGVIRPYRPKRQWLRWP